MVYLLIDGSAPLGPTAGKRDDWQNPANGVTAPSLAELMSHRPTLPDRWCLQNEAEPALGTSGGIRAHGLRTKYHRAVLSSPSVSSHAGNFRHAFSPCSLSRYIIRLGWGTTLLDAS